MKSTLKEWMQNEYDKDQLKDIAEHGADAGWTGISYTRDCVELFDKYQDEIWEMAAQMADDLGEKNVPTLVAGFQRADMASSVDGFKSLMVWFAVEEYARQMTDETEVA